MGSRRSHSSACKTYRLSSSSEEAQLATPRIHKPYEPPHLVTGECILADCHAYVDGCRPVLLADIERTIDTGRLE